MNETLTVNKKIVNVKDVIDGVGMNRFVVTTMLLSFIILILDGFDMLFLSFMITPLSAAWGVPPGAFGSVMAFGNIGLIAGAFIFGYVGDKFGRKKAIIISTLIFSVFTLITAFSTGLQQLVILRVLATVGVGGLQPAIFVVNSDHAPRKGKMKRVTVLFAGANLGGALGGFLAANLIPRFGWPAMCLAGGILPLIVLVLLIAAMPESVCWLAANNKDGSNDEKIRRLIRKLRPDYTFDENTEFSYITEGKKEKSSVKELMTGRMAYLTPMLWICFMIANFTMLFTLTWMPTLLVQQGMEQAQAALISAVAPLAGIIGSTLSGQVFDKIGFKWGTVVPVATFAVVALLGFTPFSIFTVMVALLGICVAGHYAIFPAFVPLFYSVNNRSNASGIALSVSKIGTILAPLIGGMMISSQLPFKTIFIAAASPCILSAIFLFILTYNYQKYYSEK